MIHKERLPVTKAVIAPQFKNRSTVRYCVYHRKLKAFYLDCYRAFSRYDAQHSVADAHLSGRITGLALECRLIQPGKPIQNGFTESFNGCFHDECLNEHGFSDVSHARKTISEWRQDYNEYRPPHAE
jgi:hypothetical protein